MLSPSEGISADPKSLEKEWGNRVRVARDQFDSAFVAYQKALKTFRERGISTPDGGQNLSNALKAEKAARTEYMRVLRKFKDLILYGKIPSEK